MYVWPYPPNWKQSFEATLRFQTEILTSRKGKEQRIAKRFEPRISFEFQSLAARDAFREIQRELFVNLRNEIVVPFWPDKRKLVTDAPVGTLLEVSETRPWMVPGALICVLSKTTGEAHRIASIAGTTVTLETPLNVPWAAGSTVAEGFLGRMDADTRQRAHTSAVSTVGVVFEVTPGSTQAQDLGSPSAEVDGLEVLDTPINWRDAVSVSVIDPRRVLDYGRGIYRVTHPYDFPTITRKMSFLRRGFDTVRGLENFFRRHRGMQREFYFPNMQADLIPVSGIVAGETTLEVEGPRVAEFLTDNTVHRAVAIRTLAGVVYGQIESAISSAGTTVLYFREPWEETTPLSAMGEVSVLNVTRFGSDALTLEWKTDDVATIRMAVQTLEDHYDEEDAEGAQSAFTWGDVFTDQTAHGGEDWSGWGESSSTPGEKPLEFFLRERLPELRATGATVTLDSPSGVLHLRGRVQPPTREHLNSWTLDFADTLIERGKNDTVWGQMHMWGEVSEAALPSQPSVGVSAFAGGSSLELKDDADTTAFLAVAAPGSIALVRTNATSENYHPEESRQVVYIQSIAGRVLTLSRPLEIDVPVNNPVGDFPGETNDPSTVTLLNGSTLSSDAPEGGFSVVLQDAADISIGDWVYLSTSEIPTPGGHQFSAISSLLVGTEEFGDIPINEEMHRVQNIVGNTLTLETPLGKNKLTAWNAACVKVEPIANATVRGGRWAGYDDGSAALPWQHQYIWGRYCVNCVFTAAEFDKESGRSLAFRRMGQAVRSDTGSGNQVSGNYIGQAGGIDAGEGYGVSLRRGERGSVVSGNDIEKCRHSIELWSTTAGCVVDGNTVRDDTSSSLDTHGSWNKGVIIRNNTISNSGLVLSSDLGGLPDAIRIGNNKFLWDEDIQVLNNTVQAYRGNAVSVVPGSRRVTVDGLVVNNADRVLKIARNSRHPALFAEDITIQNVTADDVRDRLAEVDNTSNSTHVKNLTLKDWTVGGSSLGTIDDPSILNFRLFWVENLRLENIDLAAIHTQQYHYAWHFEDVTGLTLVNCEQNGGERGVRATRTSGISGDVTIRDLTANTAHVFRDVNDDCSGSLSIFHAGAYTPVVVGTQVSITLAPE